MKIFSILLFLIIFIGLIFFQRDVINPLLFDVASSDLFLEDSDDIGDMVAISTPMTEIAYMHCNTNIREDIDQDISIVFQPKPLYAWALGGQQYVINGEIETTSKNSPSVITKYVCRIHYSKGENEDEIMKYENWSVYGISGLDEL